MTRTPPPTITQKYLLAGSDIIETNTFNANSISQADYNMKDLVYEMNVEAVKIARRACETVMKERPNGPKRFVAGAIGPTNKTLSVSKKVEDAGYRDCS